MEGMLQRFGLTGRGPEVDEPTMEGPFAAPGADGKAQAPEHAEDEIDDYDALEDAPAVQADLQGMRSGWGLRAILTGILGAALLYLGLTAAELVPPITAISPTLAPGAYLGVNLLLLLICMGLSYDVFRDGWKGLRGAPSSMTMPAAAAAAAAVQLLLLLITSSAYDPMQTTVFAGPAALLLCFALVGKAVMGGVVQRNFEIVSQGVDHAAAYQVDSPELTAAVSEGLGEPDPHLLLSRPTALVRGFLRQSFSQAPSDALSQKLSRILLIASGIAGAAALVGGAGFVSAVSAVAGALALGTPLCSTLLAAVPCLLMQRSAAAVDAVVPGWSAVRELGSANMVMVGAEDLFPAGSVWLHCIKTFERQRIDLAILYTASVLVKACPTLRGVFMKIIEGNTEMLYPVENLACETGCTSSSDLTPI